jgi:hypothetical protein
VAFVQKDEKNNKKQGVYIKINGKFIDALGS